MRRTVALLSAVLGAAALSGALGGGGTTVAAAPPPALGPVVLDPLRPPEDLPPVLAGRPWEAEPARRLETHEFGGLVSTPWTFARLEKAGQRLVFIHHGFNNRKCATPAGVRVVEEDDRVVIALLSVPRPGSFCPLPYIVRQYRYVDLATPLGDRPLYHAAT